MSATEATPNDALNPHGSAWVGANAGAGKTYILVSRLVRLMLDGGGAGKIAVPDLYARRGGGNAKPLIRPIGRMGPAR